MPDENLERNKCPFANLTCKKVYHTARKIYCLSYFSWHEKNIKWLKIFSNTVECLKLELQYSLETSKANRISVYMVSAPAGLQSDLKEEISEPEPNFDSFPAKLCISSSNANPVPVGSRPF
jgi:hypothetical protein